MRCQVLTAILKTTVFWVVTPCSKVELYRRFRGACCLHHQGDLQQPRRRITIKRNTWKSVFTICLNVDCVGIFLKGLTKATKGIVINVI
jgi:hypothetical protein